MVFIIRNQIRSSPLDIHSCSLEKPAVSYVILDGPVIAPVNSSTFRDYAWKVFSPFMYCQLESCIRVDIVWEFYKENTLKVSATRKKGSGTHRRVLPDSKIPYNWHSFLQINESREELF